MICLEYFGCEGCKFMCPTPSTLSPTSHPTDMPTMGPTTPPSKGPTTGPTAEPTTTPTPAPSAEPTTSPSAEPTPAPSPSPSAEPTAMPSGSPSSAPSGTPTIIPSASPSVPPTSGPSGTPTIMPTSAPTIPPTGAPTPTPDFWVYYSCYDSQLYSYNPIVHKDTYLYDSDFSGDLNVDSVNKFLFWSSPDHGNLIKYDLTADEEFKLIEDYDGLMGIAADPSRGELYFVDQGYLAINIIDYAGTNYSTVHDLADYNLVPFAIDVSPSATVGDFNLNDPGIMFITGCDDTDGYIAQANLFGGLFEVVYQSTSKAMYGLVIDTEANSMYWIEDRGVANGMYSATLAGDDQSFVNYQENSFWLAAIWSLDIIYTADYSEGLVYELDINTQDGSVQSAVAVAECDNPRVIAYYYGSDDTTLSEIEGNTGSAPPAASVGPVTQSAEDSPDGPIPSDAPSGSPGTIGTTESTDDTTEDSTADSTAEASPDTTESEDPADAADADDVPFSPEPNQSPEGAIPSDAPEGAPGTPGDEPSLYASFDAVKMNPTMFTVGGVMAVVGVVGMTVYHRRHSDYRAIPI